jgi:polysaccharide export outer membrane protein
VEGFAELSDTFNVNANRSIILPEIGTVPLNGVLRAELQTHLTSHLAKFINHPVVYARSLVRLEVVGAVLRPGFYVVPSDVLLTDALMLAGGPLSRADLEKIRVERSGTVIWTGDRLRDAVIEGRTLDQLSIRAGDSIHVPESSSALEGARNVIFLVGGLASIVGILLQVF